MHTCRGTQGLCIVYTSCSLISNDFILLPTTLSSSSNSKTFLKYQKLRLTFPKKQIRCTPPQQNTNRACFRHHIPPPCLVRVFSQKATFDISPKPSSPHHDIELVCDLTFGFRVKLHPVWSSLDIFPLTWSFWTCRVLILLATTESCSSSS